MTRALGRACSVAFGLSLLTGGGAMGQGEKLYMHYMPWFQTPDVRGYWGPHWTGFNGEADPDTFVGPDNRRDIHSKYYPLIEPYDSADPDVLEYQLLTMKLAGVDGVLVDWYGLGSIFDYPENQVGSLAMFEAAGELGMEFAVVFEDFTIGERLARGDIPGNDVQADLNSTLAWLETNWFSASHYARFNGRPLFLTFGPQYVFDAASWNNAFNSIPSDPNFFALPGPWAGAGADGAFHWIRFDAYAGSPSDLVVRQRFNNINNSTSSDVNRVIPGAAAGMDTDYQFGECPSCQFLDHDNGRTIRLALEAALDGNWPAIQLITWNDYTEGTMIEPTREFGYTFVETIQQEVRERDPGFVPVADDLRLPAQLLAFRRAGFPDAALDPIAQDLAAFDIASARARLADPLAEALRIVGGDRVVEGGAVLTLEADLGVDALSLNLRWERDGVPIENSANVFGAEGPLLILSGVSPEDAGVYRLTAEVGGVSGASSPVIVAVRPGPLGPVDVNGDGVVAVDDLDAFLRAVADAAP